MTDTLSPAAREALKACLSTRGPSKGLLLQTAPSRFSFPAGYAAWQAATLSCNPYKASIIGSMLIAPIHRPIYDEILAFFDAHPELRGLDRDRAVLERLGVW